MIATTEDSDVEIKPYAFYEQITAQKILHFYISSAIGEPELYIDMVHKIQTASSNDTIFIHLNTPGGDLETGIQIINAMRLSAGHIVVGVEAVSHSLATMIFLAADEFIINDNCLMMFHNFSGGTYGKGNEQQARLEATIKWFNEFTHDLYVPFLSEDEFDRIIKGEDIWMKSSEIKKRLEKMVRIMKKELKQKHK